MNKKRLEEIHKKRGENMVYYKVYLESIIRELNQEYISFTYVQEKLDKFTKWFEAIKGEEE